MLKFMYHTPDKPLASKPKLTVRGVFLQFCCFWLIYTLSIGPMYWTWFGATYVGGSYWVIAFYSPLRLACAFIPVYGDLVESYIWWWNFPPPESLSESVQQIVAS